jgi:hypothetical protein
MTRKMPVHKGTPMSSCCISSTAIGDWLHLLLVTAFLDASGLHGLSTVRSGSSVQQDVPGVRPRATFAC